MTLSTIHWTCSFFRWVRIQGALSEHKQKLAAALEIHAFNRDVDDINERINEKVKHLFAFEVLFYTFLFAKPVKIMFYVVMCRHFN